MEPERAEITRYLLSLGFKPGNSGFYYLCELIFMHFRGEEIAPLSKRGYAVGAQKFRKSAATVDKSIQNAVSSAWMRGDIERLYTQFGNTIGSDRGKPGNLQFIFQACENLRCRRVNGCAGRGNED